MMSKRLLRDTQNEKIADVCSGITHRLQLDPVLIRLMFLGWMFLGLLGFIGVVAGGLSIISYIMLWIVMPDDRRHSIIE